MAIVVAVVVIIVHNYCLQVFSLTYCIKYMLEVGDDC